MKIAILTLPLHSNYGGILQAYALQTVLRAMGHEADVLQKLPTYGHNPLIMPLVFAKRLYKKLCVDRNTLVFAEATRKKERPVVERHLLKFIGRYIRLRELKKLADIRPADYDAYVVGSDQVWRKSYFCGLWLTTFDDAFLRFTKGWPVRRLAYAASFGLDRLEGMQLLEYNRCVQAVQHFDAVSVREETGVEICRDEFATDARLVIDPTMLLRKEDYETLVRAADVEPSAGNMMCYILDRDAYTDSVVERIAREKGLTPFNANKEVGNYSLPAAERVQPPVEAWLRGFMDAEFVVTDSFHACVFSILFGKPFIAIGNKTRGLSRFTTLLKTFGLEHRLVLRGDDVPAGVFGGFSAEASLEAARSRAMEYLRNNLSTEE